MIIRKPFYYIRHGQTDWNVERRFQGSMDIPLNKTGIAQAHTAKELMRGLPITQIFSSTLQRTRVTADIVNEGLNLPIVGMDGLQEVNFGVYEGKLSPREGFSGEWQKGMTPDQAESYIDFTARVFNAVNEVLEQDGTPLIVAHGAVFWPVHTHMQLGMKGSIPNAHPVHLAPPPTGQDRWVLTEV